MRVGGDNVIGGEDTVELGWDTDTNHTFCFSLWCCCQIVVKDVPRSPFWGPQVDSFVLSPVGLFRRGR